MRTGDDRHRHQRDRRHAGVDQRHGEGADRDDSLQVARPDVDVGGEVGGSLDPGVGEHRHHCRVDDVVEVGTGEEVDLIGEAVGMEDRQGADADHRQLQGDVGEGEDGERALPAATGDVEDVEQAGGDDHSAGDADLPARLGEVAGDRLQVMRDRDRGQGGDD